MIGPLSLGKIWQQVLGNAAQSFMVLPDWVPDEESLQKQTIPKPGVFHFSYLFPCF